MLMVFPYLPWEAGLTVQQKLPLPAILLAPEVGKDHLNSLLMPLLALI